MGLLNSKTNPPVAVPPSVARTFTNAPKHWPAVSFAKAKPGADQFFSIVGVLAEPLQQQGATMHVMRTYIYDDGLLDVPLAFEENGATTCVFYYPSAGADAAAHYASVRQVLKQREGATAVFYCPEPMGQGTPRPVLGPLDPKKFTKPSEPAPDARYALWWTTPEDPSFGASEDRALIDRWFEALHGYAHVLFSMFVNELRVVEPKDGRPQLVGLPEDAFALQLAGHGGVPLMMRASTAEGFVLAFDTRAVTAAQRRTYLRLLASLAEGCRARAIKERVRADENDLSLANWRAARDEALEAEAAGQVAEDLYVVAVAGGQIVGDAGAPPPQPPPLPGNGAGAIALPSDEALQFAVGLMETAAANLRQTAVQASTDDELGQMNLAPVVVARVGGHLWRRTLVGDGGDHAIAAASRARDEWPDARLVAVLLDGAIREGDTRVDVLRVLVQEGDAAAGVFWRYTTVEDGAISLYGRPGAEPIAAFAAAPQPPPLIASGFDHTLFTLANEVFLYVERYMALDRNPARVQRWARLPIRMPFALVWHDPDKPTLCVLAFTGPQGALVGCRDMLRENTAGHAAAFAFDDVVELDGKPHRRIRVHVQRRGMPAAAIVERRFDVPDVHAPFVFTGDPVFVRWTDSLFD